MRRTGWLLALALVAVGVFLAFQVLDRPGSGSPTVGPARENGERRAWPQNHVYTLITPEPDGLNPFTVNSNVALRYVLEFTHDTLLDLDPVTGELRGAVAESWEWDADHMAFTLYLRPDVKFADGEPVTVEDVLFTWEVARAEGAILGSIGDGLGLVREVEVVAEDPPAIRVLLKDRHFAAMEAVTRAWIVVQKRHFLAEIARRADAGQTGTDLRPGDPEFGDLLAQVQSSGPGTGPYRLVRDGDGQPRWRPGSDRLVMEQNPLSWRRRVYPDCWNLAGIRLLFLADPAAMFAAFVKRECDTYGGPDLDKILADRPELKDHYRIVDYDYLNLGHFCIHWNHRREATGKPLVRRALSMLFDRRAIAEEYMAGTAVPAVSPMKPGTRFYPDAEPPSFDPAAARVLLREAGYDAAAGRPLKISVVAQEYDLFRQILGLAQDAANKAGVQFDWRMVPNPGLDQGDWDGALFLQEHHSWVDPYPVFHSMGPGNDMGYANPEVDDLLERARREFDVDARKRLYDQFQTVFERDQPVTLLVHPRVRILFNSHIADAEPGPLGMYPERWWVPDK